MSVKFLIPYILIIFVSTYYSYFYSKTNLTFERNTFQGLLVKGGVSLYLIYIITLFIRITINVLFFGYYDISIDSADNVVLSNHPFIVTTHYTKISLLIITDFLLMFGAGLLIGRNLMAIKYYYQECKSI